MLTTPLATTVKIYHLNLLDSSFMKPPAQENDLYSLKFLKSPNYFFLVMAHLERLYETQKHLSGHSLGALGNLLEFIIRNQMHMRWSSVQRDPKTDDSASRDDFDFDPKWDDPKTTIWVNSIHLTSIPYFGAAWVGQTTELKIALMHTRQLTQTKSNDLNTRVLLGLSRENGSRQQSHFIGLNTISITTEMVRMMQTPC